MTPIQLMERAHERYTIVEKSDSGLAITIAQRKQWVSVSYPRVLS